MKQQDILKEIQASKKTIKDLEEIKKNAEIGLEVNKYVLGKLEEWKHTLQ